MKKVLNILSAGTSSVVACKDNDVITSKDKNYSENKVNDISLAQDLIDNSGIKKAIYSEKTIRNKLNASMMELKNKIDLFNSNEQLLEENRFNYSVNNFVNNNLQPSLHFY